MARSGMPLESMAWDVPANAIVWPQKPASQDIVALEEALCEISAGLVRVQRSDLGGRELDHAKTFLETGLLWLETAIGGAKEKQ